MSSARRFMPAAIALVIVVGASVVLIRTLAGDAAEIRVALRSARWWWIAPSAALALVSVAGLAERWRAALRLLGAPVPLGVAIRDFSAGQLGKYMPGGVWQFVGQGELAVRRGVPRRVAYASVMLSTISLVGGASLFVAVVGLTPLADDTPWWAVGVGAAIIAGLILPTGRHLMRRVLRLEITVAPVDIMRCAMGAVPVWMLIGTATWMIARSMVDVPLGNVVVAAVGSWLVGIVFLPAPGGIGVREAVFAATLTSIDPTVSTGTAALIALLARAVFMCADAAWLPLGRLVTRRDDSWRAPSSTAEV